MGGAGLQAFVGAGLAVDEELVEEEVRNAVRMELVGIIRELSGKEGYISPSNTRSVSYEESKQFVLPRFFFFVAT